MNDEYVTEKIEAYNLAIDGLRRHESDSDPASDIAKRLRNKLADKLDREIQRWCDRHMTSNKD